MLRAVLVISMSLNSSIWFVAIGASGADGLHDIKRLIAALPVELDAAVLVVLHRLWDRPSYLAAVLRPVAHHPVVIASDGEAFSAGTIYIGEPSQHLTLVERSFGALVDDPDRAYGGRTVDLLFRSVARHGGRRIIGVVLAGSLDDGARGLALIHEVGGLTMVVRPQNSGYAGMPENAIAYDGPIDLIGSPTDIAVGIADAVRRG